MTTEAGRNDTTSRFVLVALAQKARGEEPRAWPSITTIRYMTGLDREVIRRALRRLADGGLITDVGRRGEGVVCWQLNTDLVRPDTDLKAIEAEVDERKAKDRLRKQRARSTEDESTVLNLDGEAVSTVLGADAEDVSALRTADSAVLSRDSTVLRLDSTTQNSRELVRTGDEPVNEPIAAEQASAAAPAADDVLFDAAPTPKPKKAGKKAKPVDPRDAQAQDLATRYYEAMSKQVPFMGVKTVVKNALTVFSFDQVRAGLIHMSTVDRYRPLTRQTLLAAIEAPNSRPANGHQPYRNPVDQSVYDEPLI